MSGAEGGDQELIHECAVFTRYLIGLSPTEYVTRKYVAAHGALDVLTPVDRFDRLLLRLAKGTVVTRWPAAAFARVAAPDSALQKKLVTLLAILETDARSGKKIDTAPSASALTLVVLLGLRGFLAAVALLAGAVLLAPLRVLLSGHRSRG